MEIEIMNWEKYNPRKELKTLTWLRLDSDIGFSESLFGLNAEARWLWIFILSYSAKKNSGKFSIDSDYVSYHSSVKKENIFKHLELFAQRGLISIITDSSRISTDSIENVSYVRTNVHTPPNGTDYTHPLDLVSSEKIEFDFNAVYAAYPKKEGKKIGIDRLKKIVTTQDKYDSVLLAVQNYAKQVKGTDLKYIKQFSSFVSVWEDYLEVQVSERDEAINFLIELEEKAKAKYLAEKAALGEVENA